LDGFHFLQKKLTRIMFKANDQSTDALIAAMLADEDLYLNPYIEDANNANYIEDDQEDYVPNHTNWKSRPSKKRKLAKVKKAISMDKSTSKKVRAPWTADEEQAFLLGLETYGRDWSKISELLTSRDAKNVSSHAQRHFIRLWYNNKDLPAKVQESGKGHTLSGKLLDPESSFARIFLKNKPQRENRFPLPERTTKSTKMSKNTVQSESKAIKFTSNKKRKIKASGKKKRMPGKRRDTAEKTYQLALPRRYNPKRRRCNQEYRELCSKLDNADPLELHNYQCYRSQFGMEQPFQVSVSPLALAMADFHSHMLTNEEVIGLLIGSWDEDRRILRVLCAKPCASMQDGEDTSVNVEMSPVSELEIREWIATEEAFKFCGVVNPVVVGWYHSHPVFEPIPSTKDIENHRRYQRLLENSTAAWDAVPFVGLIVGPWDIGMINERSVLKWFSVKKVDDIAHSGRGFPMKINVISESAGVTASQINILKSHMVALAKLYSELSDFKSLWRGFRYKKGVDGEYQRVIGSVTRLEKLKGSLKSALEDLDVKLTENLLRDVLESIENK